MDKTNFHTHSLYCDGKAPLEAFVRTALNHHFSVLGFSSHAPVPFSNGFAVAEDQLPVYCREVRALQEKYAEQIQIFLGLEADYIPGVTRSFSALRASCGLDYIIGSVHLVVNPDKKGLWFIDGPRVSTYDNGLKMLFDNDIRAAVGAYYTQIQQMIRAGAFEIIGHLDKIVMHNNHRFFSTDAPWYTTLMTETLEQIRQQNLIVEVNPRGRYKGRCSNLFPEEKWLPVIREMKIPVMLNSDAHHPDDLMKEYDYSLAAIRAAGFSYLHIYDGANFIEQEIR
ncbi:MAG: histidinol-phosphatase [Bacteroidales bacterium]|nr:histidinol-phosphatase [Bacteroidales bacterium]MDD3011006.1 histidinol-phosphatase [Bacteroidales bacterium]MDD3961900.1 histidinol-phosphatase [Bacteroidales bacterium]HPE87780.1 histidinol-phosphatase [Bacteroidales bacterium]